MKTLYKISALFRKDIGDLKDKMLTNPKIPLEQKRGIKKFWKKIQQLPNSNVDGIDSYKLGYEDGYRDKGNE